MSRRAAAREFGLARKTVSKMLEYSVPPGYQRQKPVRRPKLGPWQGVIDAILEDDKQRPRKQRHTAKRIFERLRAEHGYTGGYTIVKDYVRSSKIGGQEMFIPLTHAPGEAQADFGEAMVVIAGVEQKAHFMAFDLPHSDDCFVQAFPAETTEAFLEAHVRAFEYFGGVPTRILYDNTTLAVAGFLATASGRRRGPSPSCRATTCSPRSSAVRPRATTRARWRTWSATRGATSWCRFRERQAGRRSTSSSCATPGPPRAAAARPHGDHRRTLRARPRRVAAAAGGSLRGLR